jgi:hypothetical protein
MVRVDPVRGEAGLIMSIIALCLMVVLLIVGVAVFMNMKDAMEGM